MSQREVVSIHVGQAGAQMGSSCWELLCEEHHIGPDGRLTTPSEGTYSTFFEQTSRGQYVPRALYVDLESSVLDEFKRGKFEHLFNPSSLITGKEDAANNYARGRYTVGKNVEDEVVNTFRTLIESCENLQSVMVTHSCAGGTGSGLTALLMQSLSDDLLKKIRFGLDVYPSFKISTSLVEAYNTVLFSNACKDHFSLNLVLDNEAIYDICTHRLQIKSPSYDSLNRIMSQLVSSITVSCRFPGELNTDINEFQTNLVPFPNLHYLISSFSPLLSKKKSSHENLTCHSLTTSALHPDNRMAKCDILKGISCGTMLLYRGKVSSNDVNASLKKVQESSNHLPKTVSWIPCGYKIGLNSKTLTTVEGSCISPADKALSVLMNNSSVTQLWTNTLNNFALMFQKRAFTHWYVGEAMEHAEFEEAQENLKSLIQSYDSWNSP